MRQDDSIRHCRAIFISDVHLGTKASKAELLIDFLKHHDADVIYLVGDIVDFWRIRRSAHWPQAHNDVLQKILRKVRKGTRVVLLPGNHDEALRSYCGMRFGGIEIVDSIIHVAATGKRMLVIHGDQFDVVVHHAKWLAFIGDWSYTLALNFNTLFNRVRKRFGFGYWSISAYLKQKVKQAVSYMGDFEQALTAAAAREGADGVICGHIHHAAMKRIGTIDYVNTGDWVESGTAVVENPNGEFEIIEWLQLTESRLKVERAQQRLKLAA